MYSPDHDWLINDEPCPGLGGRQTELSRGKYAAVQSSQSAIRLADSSLKTTWWIKHIEWNLVCSGVEGGLRPVGPAWMEW